MRPTQSLVRLALCLSSVSPLVSAWPGWLPDVDTLVVRADETESDTKATGTNDSKSSVASVTSRPTVTTASSTSFKAGKKTDFNLNTAKAKTGTDTATATGTGTEDEDSRITHTQFAPDAPPAGVSMKTPAAAAVATPLYKIGDYVTWGWNYTSLLGTPTAIDVLASCSVARATWTLTANMTFETDVSYVWNTNDQADSAESALLSEMYTLIIKDSDASITDRPEPGYLGSYSGLTFGLYAGQPYTPFPEWKCIGCNAATSGFDRHAVGFALTMCMVTVFSFTWFVSGLGLQ